MIRYIAACSIVAGLILIIYYKGYESGKKKIEQERQEQQINVQNETIKSIVKVKKIAEVNRNLDRDALIDKL